MRKVIFILLAILIIACAATNNYAAQEESSTEAFLNKGGAYYERGDYAAALDAFQSCLDAAPDCQDCRVRLASAQAMARKRDKAMRVALLGETENNIAQTPLAQPAQTKDAAPQDNFPAPGLPESPQDNIPKISPGAWTLPQGKFYAEIYNKYYWHRAEFNNSGDKISWQANGHYDEIRSELKLEYGLSDELTALLYLPYKQARWHDDNNKSATRGLVDMWLGTKYRLLSQPCILSLQTRIKIPGNYNENDSPSLGRRQLDGEIKFLLGKSLSPLFNGYTKAEIGWRGRSQEPTNEIPYFYELGYNLTSYLTLKATLDGIQGISGTGKVHEDYAKWNISTIWGLGEYALELGYGLTFAGKNSSAAEEIILALSVRI